MPQPAQSPGSSAAGSEQQRSAAAQNPAPQQGGAGGGDAGGDNVVDLETYRQHFAPIIEQQNNQIRQLESYNQQNQRVLTRLQKAFTGEEEPQLGKDGKPIKQKKANPKVGQYGQSLDFLLQSALKGEREGRPFPVTTEIGSDFYEFAMEALQREEAMREQLDAMKAQLDKQGNPRKVIWDQSMMDFDNLIRNAMATIYGADETYGMQRDAQWDAVSKQIMTELQDLAQNEPDTLDAILRSPQKRRDMVTHFTKMNIPPRARQILEEQRLQNTVQSSADLEKAWLQAEAIEDPRERNAVRTKIRIAHREQKWVEQFGNRGRGRPGQVMLQASLYGEGRQPAYRTY